MNNKKLGQKRSLTMRFSYYNNKKLDIFISIYARDI